MRIIITHHSQFKFLTTNLRSSTQATNRRRIITGVRIRKFNRNHTRILFRNRIQTMRRNRNRQPNPRYITKSNMNTSNTITPNMRVRPAIFRNSNYKLKQNLNTQRRNSSPPNSNRPIIRASYLTRMQHKSNIYIPIRNSQPRMN